MQFWTQVKRFFRVVIYKLGKWRRPHFPTPTQPPAGFLKVDELEKAQRMQKELRAPFDKIMIDLGFVGEREVLQAKAKAMGMPFIDLERTPIDPNAIALVPRWMAEKHLAIPVKKQDRQMWVAMSNAHNIQAIDQLSTATECRIIPVIAVPSAIEAAIQKHYSD